MLIGSTATNELLVLDSKTGERRRVVRDIIDPYQLGFSPDGKWFVTVAYRLDHVDIFHADGFKLAGRIFIDGLPSHMAFDAELQDRLRHRCSRAAGSRPSISRRRR